MDLSGAGHRSARTAKSITAFDLVVNTDGQRQLIAVFLLGVNGVVTVRFAAAMTFV